MSDKSAITLNRADETYCNVCGKLRSEHSTQDEAEVETCVSCGAWEHIAVDGQNADFPAGHRCWWCWQRMPFRRRYRWLRWHLGDHLSLNPDEVDGRQLALEGMRQ